jgi:hypothetical protein
MDFSLTTLFVVPAGQTTFPNAGSATQDLTAGQVGIFGNNYKGLAAGGVAAVPYFYVAQGRANTFLQGSKRSDKIAGSLSSGGNARSNVTEWYKVTGCGVPASQITDISNFKVKAGEDVTVTLRAHSSYIDMLYFNGFTRSVTIAAPCLECDGDPCADVDVDNLINELIAKFKQTIPGNNPDNISFNTFYQFQKVGTGPTAILRITGKALTAYGLPCDVSAFPFEYDRMSFRTFVNTGADTTVDFLVSDACEDVAAVEIIQRATYATGTSEEIAQLEKNFYSYQAGYMKHLYKLAGYNANFETYVAAGIVYDTYYVKFNELDRSSQNWGDYISTDSMVIIAVPQGAASTALQAILVAGLGPVAADNVCVTTTSTTTAIQVTTTTSSTLIP